MPKGAGPCLLILQGLDTAGKDGVIKHVLSGINPQGCEVHSFKQPSTLELAHDFLWRSTIALPARGRISIFNRSYYEETVVVRVHPELLEKQNLPPKLVTDNIWTSATRTSTISNCISPAAAPCRSSSSSTSPRTSSSSACWRASTIPTRDGSSILYDVEERRLWEKFIEVYEDTIRNTATAHAPWYVDSRQP